MTRDPKQILPCEHWTAEWRASGPSHVLLCRRRREVLDRVFAAQDVPSGVLFKRPEGYQPFDPSWGVR